MNAKCALAAGALAGAFGVLLGAGGAHLLRDASALATWQTAVDYQFRHALALLATGLLHARRASRAASVAASGFALGIVLFCGSLYARALGAPPGLVALAPFGGVAFLAGWLALAWHAWQVARADAA